MAALGGRLAKGAVARLAPVQSQPGALRLAADAASANNQRRPRPSPFLPPQADMRLTGWHVSFVPINRPSSRKRDLRIALDFNFTWQRSKFLDLGRLSSCPQALAS
jgi:hypothetical protein